MHDHDCMRLLKSSYRPLAILLHSLMLQNIMAVAPVRPLISAGIATDGTTAWWHADSVIRRPWTHDADVQSWCICIVRTYVRFRKSRSSKISTPERDGSAANSLPKRYVSTRLCLLRTETSI